LAGSSPSDRVAKALTALGRVVKTIYILRYLVRVGEILARLRVAGKTVSDQNLARISPLAYVHVIPNRTGVFNRSHSRGSITVAALP
jgi:hypothetical protein